MRKHHPKQLARKHDPGPAQLSLPGSLTEVVDLRRALAHAEAMAQEHFDTAAYWRGQALAESTETERLSKENVALQHEVLVLQQKNAALNLELVQRILAGLDSTPTTAGQDQLARELRRIVGLVHPDKWGGHPLADLVTKELLELRSKIN